jgi:RNA polymerase sigma factor FliA
MLRCVRNSPPTVTAEQEALVIGAYWLARCVVSDVAARLPRSVDRQDLHSVALVGLVNAARVFDPSIGVPFEAFARARMRWAVLDELRAQDPLSRADRRRASAAVHATTDVSQDRVTMIASRRADGAGRPAFGGVDDLDDAVDPGATSPETHAIERDLVDSVRGALGLLPPRCRSAVVAHFIDGRDMRSIADELGVSPSRVSQLCTEGVRRLRGLLRSGNWDESLAMQIAS